MFYMCRCLSLSDLAQIHPHRLSSWEISSERKNLGFLFALDHGAEQVVDLARGESLPSAHPIKGYIPVTYPTGLLWNPFPSMLAVSDTWPKNFPAQLREIKQEVLNEAMERVPAASIAIVQSLPTLNPQLVSPLSPMIALGLKTFAPITEATTLFTKSALWALFLPKHETSAVIRGLFAQPLLWRLGLYTAFSLSTSSQENREKSYSEADIDVQLLEALQQTNLTACANVVDCLTLIYSQHHEVDLPHLVAWLSDLGKLGYEAPHLRPHRKFVYLSQGAALTTTSHPRRNGVVSNSSSSYDTFYVSFSNGSGDLFFPNSTFQQGRNALLRLALSMEVSPGYSYFVFTGFCSFLLAQIHLNWLISDEDVKLETVDHPSHFWKTNMSKDPWIRIEVRGTIIEMKKNENMWQFPPNTERGGGETLSLYQIF